jgi:hypothetical protein
MWGVSGLHELHDHDKSGAQAALDAVHQHTSAFTQHESSEQQKTAFAAFNEAVTKLQQELTNIGNEAAAQGHPTLQPAIENLGTTITQEASSIGAALGA